MSIWQDLGIEETIDVAQIKKAYRQKLRDCHPESDPEGFQKLRTAYEQALAYGEKSSKTETKLGFEQSVVVQETPKNEFYQDALQLLNSSKRIDLDAWNIWAQKVTVAPLADQEILSVQMKELIIGDCLYLPGDIIELFWKLFDWQLLLRSMDEEIQAQVEFLNHWRLSKGMLPLEYLKERSDPEQRSILSYYAQATVLLQMPNIYFLKQWQSTATVTSYNHPKLLLLNLQIQKATEIYAPPLQLISDIEWLVKEHAYYLSTDDWILLSELVQYTQNEKLLFIFVQHFLDQKNYPHVTILLYYWYQDKNTLLSAWFAGLATTMGWVSGTIQFKVNFNFAKDLRFSVDQPTLDWLRDIVTSRDLNYFFRSKLALDDISNHYEKALVKRLWAISHGSWVFLKSLLETPILLDPQLNDQKGWQALSELLTIGVKSIYQQRPEAPELNAINHALDQYESKEWFSIQPLTQEMLPLLTPIQWQDLYCRHPLLPRSWFQPLAEAAILSRSFFSSLKESKSLYLAYDLGEMRPLDFELTTAWKDREWDLDFDTIFFYYTFNHHLREEVTTIIQRLPSLPESLKDTPLYQLKEVTDPDPETRFKNILWSCTEYPEQWVFYKSFLITIRLFNREVNDNEKISEMIMKGDFMALCYVVDDLIKKENVREAILFLMLLSKHAQLKAPFIKYVEQQGEQLRNILAEQGIDLDELTKQNFPDDTKIYGYLTEGFIEKRTPEIILNDNSSSDKEQHAYCYVLSLIHHGLAEGIHTSSVNEMLKEPCNTYEEELRELMLSSLSTVMNEQFQKDKATLKGKGVRQNSLILFIYALIFGIATFFLPRIPVEGDNFILSVVAYIQEEGRAATLLLWYIPFVLNYIYSLIQLYYGARSVKKGRQCIASNMILTIGLMLFFNSPLAIFLTSFFFQVCCIALINEGRTPHGGWQRHYYQEDYLPIKDVLSNNIGKKENLNESK